MCSRDNYYVNNTQKDFLASAYRSCHPIPREAQGTEHKECFIFFWEVGAASVEHEGKTGQRVSSFAQAGNET